MHLRTFPECLHSLLASAVLIIIGLASVKRARVTISWTGIVGAKVTAVMEETAMAMTNLLMLAILWASEAGFQSKTSAAIPTSSFRKLPLPRNSWLSRETFACSMPELTRWDDGIWNKPYSGAILGYAKTKLLHRNQTKLNVGQQDIGKRIILFRTKATESEFLGGVNKTWIFSSKGNAWRSVESKAHPRCGRVCFTVTLCDSQVVVIGGSANNSSNQTVLYDRVSIFDGDEDSWFEPYIVNSELFRKFYWDIQTAAVAIVDSLSTDVSDGCRCKESVFLFPPTRRWASVLKLRCVKDRREYEWKEIYSLSSPLPQIPLPNSVASVKEVSFVYVLAENGLWQFNVEKSNWKSINASLTSSNLTFSPSLTFTFCDKRFLKAYATKDSYVLYHWCEYYYVLLYDFVQKAWTLFDYRSVSFSSKTWWTTSIHVDRRIILLSPGKCRSEVWQIERQTESLWIWEMIQTASGWPHRDDGLFSSVLQEEYLYLTSSPKNGYFTQDNDFVMKPQSNPPPFVSQSVREYFSRLMQLSRPSNVITTDRADSGMSNYLDFSFWRLSMRTFIWENLRPRPRPDVPENNFLDTAVVDTVTYLSRSLIAMTGMRRSAMNSKSFLPQLHVWGHNTGDGSISYCKTEHDLYRSAPTTRYLYAVASLNSSSILLFGGTLSTLNKDTRSPSYMNETFNHSLNDTWIATIDIRRRYVRWTRIDVEHHRRHASQTKDPIGRFKHTMVKTTYTIVMYGGETNDRHCLDETWHYDVSTLSWTDATNRANSEKPRLSKDCFSIGTTLKNDAVFAVKSVYSNLLYSETSLQFWLYHPDTFSWTYISRYGVSNRKYPWEFSLHVWRRYLVVYDSESVKVVYSHLICPGGFSMGPLSANKTFCSGCGAGSFSRKDDYECTRCPIGLTTEGELSRSLLNCSRCDTSYCKYGKCDLIWGDIMGHVVCLCDNGYSETQCQHPTYILIAVGVAALFCLLIVMGGLVCWRYRLKKRRRERNLMQQVNELTDVWQIDTTEVNLLEQIGSGGFGEVYRAEYRDMIVAVKKLRCSEDEQSVREFEREILFCQTIRHPHIVLFIGAGRRDAEGTPFIVTEFMERGSLRDVLDNVGVELLPHQKVQFGVDIAIAMEFLHGLQPPRVHRDLKSNNILVGRNFSAKIADFGLGRQMPLANRDIVVGETPPGGLTTPLLNSICLTMIGIGTARWRAPELFARQNYTTAIDVYSFGILLWETWTRRLPFQNYRFDYEVHDAVLTGERPIVPEGCPADFQGVMTDCWQQEACARPPFPEILGRLRNCLVKLAE